MAVVIHREVRVVPCCGTNSDMDSTDHQREQAARAGVFLEGQVSGLTEKLFSLVSASDWGGGVVLSICILSLTFCVSGVTEEPAVELIRINGGLESVCV